LLLRQVEALALDQRSEHHIEGLGHHWCLAGLWHEQAQVTCYEVSVSAAAGPQSCSAKRRGGCPGLLQGCAVEQQYLSEPYQQVFWVLMLARA